MREEKHMRLTIVCLWDNINHPWICVIEDSDEKEKENECTEKIFDKIMLPNFLNKVKNIILKYKKLSEPQARWIWRNQQDK